MTSVPSALTVRSLSYRAGSRQLWSDLDLTAGPGQSVAVTGPSGSGKTSLLRCLSSLARPMGGAITLGTARIDRLGGRTQREFLRSDCGFVFQDYALVGEWSVDENVRVVRPRGISRGVLGERASEALIRVGLGGREHEPTSRLSGGEQQRVAIARLLVQSPRLVIADEPTAALDPASAARVRSGLELLRQNGAILVVATHDPELADWCSSTIDLG